MLYCMLQSWNANWLNTSVITADLCHAVVLLSSAKVDDGHISLKAFLFIKLSNNLLRCSRSKCLDCFFIFLHTVDFAYCFFLVCNIA